MTLKEAQDRSYDLLCMIDDICRREGIRYFLDGGSEIGSVREKDIIPWDDDIDIKMRLQDYPAFKAAMQTYLPDYIRLLEPEDFAPLFYDFTVRVVDTRYLRRKVTEEDEAYGKMENYLCIDVFLHYHIPESNIGAEIAKARVKLLYGLGLGHRYRLDYSKYSGAEKLAVAMMSTAGRLIPAKRLCRRFWMIAGRYDRKAGGSSRAFSNWATGRTEQKYAWFERAAEGELRGRKFPIPAAYDEDLSTYYGDYMHPPKDRNAYIQHLDEEDRYKDA